MACLALVPGAFGQGADSCLNADVLVGTGSFAFDTSQCSDTGAPATTSGEQLCPSLTVDVWFQWTAPSSGYYVFDTCGTANFNTEMALWRGASCSSAVGLACNDNTAECPDTTSRIEIPSILAGETYRIQIGYTSPAGGVFGNGTLQITEVPNTCPGSDDALEAQGGDSCFDAIPLAPGETPGLRALLGDDDYYVFTAAAGDFVRVDALFAHAAGDIDLILFDDNCSGVVDVAASNGDNERIVFTNTSAATRTYVLRVRFDEGFPPCNDYALELFTGPDPCTTTPDDGLEPNDSCAAPRGLSAGTQSDLFVAKTSPDHYSYSVGPGERIEADARFRHLDGDLDLNLRNAACSTSLDGSFSITDDENVLWTNPSASPQDVVLEVYVFGGSDLDCNRYDLDVTIGPDPCLIAVDDGFEDNDDCSTPVVLGTGITPGLFVSEQDADFWTIDVPADATLTATARFRHSDADIDLYLYESSSRCAALNPLVSATSTSDDETVLWTNGFGQPHPFLLEVRVFALAGGDCSDYVLEISVDSGELGANFCTATPNSTGQPASISGVGSARVSDQDVTLVASGLPAPGTPGLFFFGPTQIQTPFGDGFRCAGGMTRRVQPPAFASGALSTSRTLDFNAFYGQDFVAGASLNFQFWYRDPMAMMAGFNLTDGLNVVFQ